MFRNANFSSSRGTSENVARTANVWKSQCERSIAEKDLTKERNRHLHRALACVRAFFTRREREDLVIARRDCVLEMGARAPRAVVAEKYAGFVVCAMLR